MGKRLLIAGFPMVLALFSISTVHVVLGNENHTKNGPSEGTVIPHIRPTAKRGQVSLHVERVESKPTGRKISGIFAVDARQSAMPSHVTINRQHEKCLGTPQEVNPKKGLMDYPPNVPLMTLQGGEDIASAFPIGSLPFTDNGTTAGYNDDYDEACKWASTSPDVVYSYTPSQNENISISLCNSSYDTKVFVYENTTDLLIDCNDDGYACEGDIFQSVLPWIGLSADETYFIVVDGYDGEYGNYTLEVTQADECEFECPPGAVAEGEPSGCDVPDITNGGCNFSPPVFGSIDFGDIICGTAGRFWDGSAYFRDLDWYEFTLSNFTMITITAYAEFPIVFGLIETEPLGLADCNAMTGYIYPSAEISSVCTMDTVWAAIPAGTYWVVVTPAKIGRVDCGAEYWITLNELLCSVDCPPTALSENEPNPCQFPDIVNGGCNSSPPVFTTINLGDIYCGTSGTWSDNDWRYRDMDFYEFEITEYTSVWWSIEAEFPVDGGFFVGDPPGSCEWWGYYLDGQFTADPCNAESGVFGLDPGIYWFVVTPHYDWISANFSSVYCGLNYVLRLGTADSPYILSISPRQNDINVERSIPILATFSQSMDETSIDNSTFVVTGQSAGQIGGTYAYDMVARTATFTPDEKLNSGELISASLTTGIQSSGGIPLENSFVWSFTTEVKGGTGSFHPRAVYTLGSYMFSIQAADFDGDRDIDLAVTKSLAGTFSVLINDGSGNFPTRSDFSTLSGDPSRLIAADLDADGDVDLVVRANNLESWFNNGDATFDNDSSYSIRSNPMISADVDGDGYPDLIGTGPVTPFPSDPDSVSVMLNNGDGTFSAEIAYSIENISPSGICAGDFDSDGDIDLASSNYDPYAQKTAICVLVNDGDGTFSLDYVYSLGWLSWPLAMDCADLDDDGHLDLMIANTGDNVDILINNRDGTFGPATTYPAGHYPNAITTADVDGDGDLDIAVTHRHDDELAILPNNGDGTFGTYATFSTGEDPLSLARADFDGNGAVDFATSAQRFSEVSVHLSDWDCVDTDDDGFGDPGNPANDCLDDNCPTVYNPDQEDTDSDGVGDFCDVCEGYDDNIDTDGDTVPDGCDNCPTVTNENQANSDSDSHGDACDNCPDVDNPGQENNDGDALGDVCDEDDDNDGVADVTDNCPFIANPEQEDNDEDGIGDVCDPCDCHALRGDVNNDGNINPQDVTFMQQYVFFTNDMRVQPPNCPLETGDVNCDGQVNPQDVTFMVQYVFFTNDMFCPNPCGE